MELKFATIRRDLNNLTISLDQIINTIFQSDTRLSLVNSFSSILEHILIQKNRIVLDANMAMAGTELAIASVTRSLKRARKTTLP